MKTLVLFIGLLLFLVSFGDESRKGAWSKKDKKKARKEIKKVDADLAAFGSKKQAFIDCYLKKIEDTFDNFTTADHDIETCTKLATECAEEVMK
ncbi:MAG TPA: hypothetical protein VK177_03130 [Flavobacteriales bacterium]|nr:hypothetical protein [Flavobacteriales bacterium]